jgi:hypothetical protein
MALVGGFPVWLPLALTSETAKILHPAADAVGTREGESPGSAIIQDISKMPIKLLAVTLNIKLISPFFDCKMGDVLEVEIDVHNDIVQPNLCEKLRKT